mgnify:CR=1 FL=1
MGDLSEDFQWQLSRELLKDKDQVNTRQGPKHLESQNHHQQHLHTIQVQTLHKGLTHNSIQEGITGQCGLNGKHHNMQGGTQVEVMNGRCGISLDNMVCTSLQVQSVRQSGYKGSGWEEHIMKGGIQVQMTGARAINSGLNCVDNVMRGEFTVVVLDPRLGISS